MRYEIVITRTIVTCIAVDADNAKAARNQIENYGVLEAASDFQHVQLENYVAKITKVRPCTS